MKHAIVMTALLASAAPALVPAATAQVAPPTPGLGNFSLPAGQPVPTPTPTAAPVITLPTLTPTPAPSPRASPTPRATPSLRATPTPKPAPTQRATLTSVPSPTPAASPNPLASPSPTPSAIAPTVASVPTPTPSPTASPAPAGPDGTPMWPIIAGLVLLALFGGAAYWWKRRRDAALEAAGPTKRPQPPRAQPAKRQTAVVPPPRPTDPLSEPPSFWTPSKPDRLPEPVAPPPPPPPPPPPAGPRIEIGIAPRRAGLNLLSATAEVEVLVRNEGDAAATNIAVDVRLLNAQSAPESQLGALFAAAMGKSVTPPFEVAAGEEQAIRAVAVLPRDAIVPLMAADRPMFVPMMTVDVRYDRGDGGRAQTAAAFMIGVVRDGSDKLAPFWLDTSPRMFETIAARPHAFSVRS